MSDDWRDEPNAPAPGTALGLLSDVPEDEGREYVFGEGRDAFSLFVVRSPEGLRAYRNVCPHLQLALNFAGQGFMTSDRQQLMCKMHGAIFRLEDGRCVDGPPNGDTLTAIPVRVDEGEIVIE